MKRFWLFLVAAVAPALASDLDFVLVNETGRSFEAVYVSEVGNKDWDGNLLPNGKVLAAGGRIDVRFPGTAGGPKWDINVVDDEGVVVRLGAVDLTNADTVTLRETKGQVTAEVE